MSTLSQIHDASGTQANREIEQTQRLVNLEQAKTAELRKQIEERERAHRFERAEERRTATRKSAVAPDKTATGGAVGRPAVLGAGKETAAVTRGHLRKQGAQPQERVVTTERKEVIVKHEHELSPGTIRAMRQMGLSPEEVAEWLADKADDDFGR